MEMMGSQIRMRTRKKPRILCLHSYRTSGEILQKMMGKLPRALLEMFEFDFPDAPFPAQGKSDVEGLYDPPYYEWIQFNEEGELLALNFEEGIAYLEDYMIKHGPFDGLLGFSQGGILASVLTWMQREGLAFTQVPKIKFVIIISGFIIDLKSVPPNKLLANAFATPVECPSLHLIGEKDFMKEAGLRLLKSFVNPSVIHHSMGHTIPKLDEKGQETMLKFIDKIQEEVFSQDPQIASAL